MNDREADALQAALATELRTAQSARGLSAPKLEELAGINRDTVRRILKGDRPVSAVELVRLSEALGEDDASLFTRAKERALRDLDQSRTQQPGQSNRLAEKLTLIATSVGKTVDSLYLDVVEHMARQGFNFPRSAWQELLSTTGLPARREVLFAISAALDVDPKYLTSDASEVDHEVEAQLRFHRAMKDLGVEEVAARALKPVDADELEVIQQTIMQAIQRRRANED